jgi:hypothetical protein
MCGRVLAFLILPTPAIGSLVELRNKTCCHLAWWKVSKRTVMRFGTWANLHDGRRCFDKATHSIWKFCTHFPPRMQFVLLRIPASTSTPLRHSSLFQCRDHRFGWSWKPVTEQSAITDRRLHVPTNDIDSMSTHAIWDFEYRRPARELECSCYRSQEVSPHRPSCEGRRCHCFLPYPRPARGLGW